MNDNFGLTKEAIDLIKNCPYIINRLAKRLDDILGDVDLRVEPLEPIEISAVTYSTAECGYEK